MLRLLSFLLCLAMPLALLADEYDWPSLDDYRWPEIKAPPETKSTKPVVIGYFTHPCRFCDQAIADAKAGKFPFELKEGTPPKEMNVEAFPVFHWNGVGGSYVWPRPGKDDDSYPGAAELVRMWKDTQSKPKVIKTRAYYHQWTWPGDLRHHLETTHGINTKGMNQDDLERAHDADHNNGFGRRWRNH